MAGIINNSLLGSRSTASAVPHQTQKHQGWSRGVTFAANWYRSIRDRGQPKILQYVCISPMTESRAPLRSERSLLSGTSPKLTRILRRTDEYGIEVYRSMIWIGALTGSIVDCSIEKRLIALDFCTRVLIESILHYVRTAGYFCRHLQV